MDEETCKVEGCTNPVLVKKWQECMTHYHRFKRYGDYTTLKRTSSNATWDERLTPDKWTLTPGPLDTPCWIWERSLNADGYAIIKYHQKAYRVYRVMLERANGEPIPPGMSVLHMCDVPACINPGHLRIGTQQDNIADMVSKNRQRAPRGLSEEVVSTVKALIRGGMKQSEICRLFDIASPTVSRIATGKLYRDVP